MLGYDWIGVGEAAKLEGDIGLTFKVREGWTETATDTVYCEAVNISRTIFRVYVWNRPDGRKLVVELVSEMLGAPVYNAVK